MQRAPLSPFFIALEYNKNSLKKRPFCAYAALKKVLSSLRFHSGQSPVSSLSQELVFHGSEHQKATYQV
jgi:hypothetical protein